jgi:hypothetical protein
VSGPGAPGWYVSASSLDGYQVTAGAIACEFVADAPGGFASPAGTFSVTVAGDGRSWRFDQRGGRCADNVIHAGDRVTVEAMLTAKAGAKSGCSQ